MDNYIPRPRKKTDDKALRKYPPLTRRLLLLRGIKTEKQAEIFLHPDWERDTHNPFLMKGMDKTVKRILRAIKNNEKILIWSDYDMDGIPGAVVLYDFFKTIGYTNIGHYTPHRNLDGFGLNIQGIDALLMKEKIDLLITIDCGSTDVTQVAYAKKKNIDVIITDHHLPNEILPKAYAILNPKQKGCAYPEKMLCGAGVVFKLVQGLLFHIQKVEELQSPVMGWEKWLLDMVGMATVSDMVPLTGENRAFTYFGIVVLQKSRRLGLHALLKKARANQSKLTEDDIAFTIAPRINAASRMGHASDAFAILSTTDALEAGTLADELDKINNTRKTMVAVMKRETKRKLSKRGEMNSVIVLGNPEWKPSLLGLVASSLAEEYKRPTFLWGREKGSVIKGSCRSDGVCNMFELMNEVGDHFIDFGGHAFSGGFSLEENKVYTLEAMLHEAYIKRAKKVSQKEKMYDEELTLDDVTWDTMREVNKFAPFGEGNPKPLFLFRDVELKQVRQFGKGGEHLELCFKKSTGGVVKAISFFTSPESLGVAFHHNARITIVANLEASYFMGRTELRLRLIAVLK